MVEQFTRNEKVGGSTPLSGTIMNFIIISVCCIFITYFLVMLLHQCADRIGLVAPPQSHHFHDPLMAHGAGIGMAIAFLGGAVMSMLISSLNGLGWPLLCGGLAMSALGLGDDIHPLSPLLRLIVQGGIVAGVMLFIQPFVLSVSLIMALFVLLWWVNLTNFMDGINGLVAWQGIYFSMSILGLSMSGLITLPPQFLIIYSLLAAVIVGFLLYNRPTFRIFMGDAGGLFLGYTYGIVAWFTIEGSWLPLSFWLIIGGVFWIDSGWTLFWRVVNGEKWYRPHRQHAYQLLSDMLIARQENKSALVVHRSHSRVCILYILVNLLWLLPLAVISVRAPLWQFWLLALAWLPLLFTVWGVRYYAMRHHPSLFA